MQGQTGFFSLDERSNKLSGKGGLPRRVECVVDFEMFRPDFARAAPRKSRSKRWTRSIAVGPAPLGRGAYARLVQPIPSAGCLISSMVSVTLSRGAVC